MVPGADRDGPGIGRGSGPRDGRAVAIRDDRPAGCRRVECVCGQAGEAVAAGRGDGGRGGLRLGPADLPGRREAGARCGRRGRVRAGRGGVGIGLRAAVGLGHRHGRPAHDHRGDRPRTFVLARAGRLRPHLAPAHHRPPAPVGDGSASGCPRSRRTSPGSARSPTAGRGAAGRARRFRDARRRDPRIPGRIGRLAAEMAKSRGVPDRRVRTAPIARPTPWPRLYREAIDSREGVGVRISRRRGLRRRRVAARKPWPSRGSRRTPAACRTPAPACRRGSRSADVTYA